MALRCFIVKTDCKFTSNQLIKLLTNLSKLKFLFLIELTFEVKLSKEDKQAICKLFPDIFINITQKSTFIKWYNKNIKFTT